MKQLFFPLLALVAVCILPSCSEKFKVAAPYKNISVVYGLLDQADTAHYIRIQKAFLDDNKSAVAMAKEPDSNFYANITVVIKKVDMYNQQVIGTIPLTRVDLTNEGYPKPAGVFFNTPNYAYKFKENLDSLLIYRLVITNNSTGEKDSAEAPVINDISSATFTVKLIDDTGVDARQINFASSSLTSTVPNLYGTYTPPYNFKFEGYSSPAAVVQSVITFHWVDSNIATGQKVPHSYDFDLGTISFTSGTSFIYKPKKVDLVNGIYGGMGPAPQYIVRLIDRCDLSFYLGTYDLSTYIQIQSLQGIGLTGNEIQATYTNIKGVNKAQGIFTSKGTRTGKVTVDASTISFLKTSPISTNARIVGTAY